MKISESKDRHIYLVGDINSVTCGEVIKQLYTIESEDLETRTYIEKMGGTYNPPPIILHINSYGGEIYPGFGLYDAIENLNTDVITLAEGPAMSMGAVVLLAGKKRYATSNSIIMLHSIFHVLVGKSSSVKREADWARKMQERLDAIIKSKTKIQSNKLKSINDKEIDWYITAEEALSLGIIQGIWK